MSMKKLMDLYKQRKDKIKKRLEEFSAVGQKSDEEIFAELCYCLLTPQSKAKTADKAVKLMQNCRALYEGNENKVRACLSGVRFPNEKARRIVAARSLFTEDSKFIIREKLSKDPSEAREWLVENVSGFGYKEASHFLRNIGYRGLAILDRHILRNLVEYGVINEIPKTLTPKRYLEIEKKVREFSESAGIPIDELDLLLWSKETGEVLK